VRISRLPNLANGQHQLRQPFEREKFALQRQTGNPDLRLEGVVLTMFDVRNNLSQLVEQDARSNLGNVVFKTRIPRNVRLSEAPSFALPVLQYDTQSKGAVAYRALASELIENNAGREG
ncbi:MAG: ParA family protein, partial [Pseudomonadota bacterium]